MEIDASIYIPKNEGFVACVSYGPNDPIDLTKESLVLDMVHAAHGVYKTNFVLAGVRYLHYWFRSERNQKRFIKSFSQKIYEKPSMWKDWSVEDFEKNQKEYHIFEYGLLSHNPVLD